MTGDVVQPGVTPRAVRELFAAIEHATRTKDAVFLVHVSYVELFEKGATDNYPNLVVACPTLCAYTDEMAADVLSKVQIAVQPAVSRVSVGGTAKVAVV